jgi:hypothetical protein
MHDVSSHFQHVSGERGAETYLKMGTVFPKKFKIIKVATE